MEERKDTSLPPIEKMPAKDAANYIETEDFWISKYPNEDGAHFAILKKSAILNQPKNRLEVSAIFEENAKKVDKLTTEIGITLKELEAQGIIKRLPKSEP